MKICGLLAALVGVLAILNQRIPIDDDWATADWLEGDAAILWGAVFILLGLAMVAWDFLRKE
ncbi:MAG: hypothetical protein HY532_05375 [Chloroflexi bacterium]|nr:hypothetical protein [Chloroflexota bacterium]